MRSNQPTRRTVAGTRLLWALAFVAGALAAVPLLLSDRAPQLVRDSVIELQLADEVRRLSFGFDPYLIAHMAMWGALAFVAVMAVRTTVPAWMAMVGVGVASFGSEVLQHAATRSRTFQYADLAANTVGIVAGTVAALLFVHAVGGARR